MKERLHWGWRQQIYPKRRFMCTCVHVYMCTTWRRMASRPLRLHMFHHCSSRHSRRTKHILLGSLGEGRSWYPPHILKADITVAVYCRPFVFKWKWCRVIWYVAVVTGNRGLQPLALNATRKVTVFFQPAKIALAYYYSEIWEGFTMGCACSSVGRGKNTF